MQDLTPIAQYPKESRTAAAINAGPRSDPHTMSAVLSQNDAQCIDRFRLLRPLGRGAQGTVYLAYDPQLDRQVAIKTLNVAAAADTHHAEQLIAAAKTASSLSHPNIVPVFEVGMHAGQPFVVFEYVEGRALSDLLHTEGALPMARAVILMSQILAGMAQVHASGLLHGDIKPANILIGSSGIPRVTDFGISRRALAAQDEPTTSGTVQYMAPECFGEARSDYRTDVFALGLVFHEMLTGAPVYEAGNEYAQIYRILNEAPVAPSIRNPRIDPRIDAIVMKALQKDPQSRYADAAEMKRELDRYRVPSAADANAELKEQTVHSTVEFLLRRMALKSDFPALSASFSRINQLSSQADEASIKSISDLVIRDFALTQKLLRVVNSAAFGAGKVTKVSQAIALIGMSQLRALATGMMLSSGGKTGTHNPEVAAALTDAFVAGVISRNVGRMLGLAQVEELFICGMFSQLGQLLTLYYLGDEHAEILRRIEAEGVDSTFASRAVLGLSFDQLGMEVARHWNFPEAIVNAMRPLPEGDLAAPDADADRMWHCAGYARELCTLARESSRAGVEDAFLAHNARHAAVNAVDPAKIRALIGYSVDVALKYVAASGLIGTNTVLLDGLAALREQAGDSTAAAVETGSGVGAKHETVPAMPEPAAPGIPAVAPQIAATVSRTGLRARLARAWQSLF